jgi:hypothetical protein
VCKWARTVFSGQANSENYVSLLAANNMDGEALRALYKTEVGVQMTLLKEVCSPCPLCVRDCPIRSYRRAVRGYPASARPDLRSWVAYCVTSVSTDEGVLGSWASQLWATA